MVEPGGHIGRNVRRIREQRDIRQDVLAGLAGMSPGYLSRIERGQRAVEKRKTLLALASALRVSPGRLTAEGDEIVTPSQDDQYTALTGLRTALADHALGDPLSEPPRTWDDVAIDLSHLNDTLRPTADYVAIGGLLPSLLGDLYGVADSDSEHRHDALRGLLDCYGAATYAAKYLNAPDLASVAAFQAKTVAGELGSAAWGAFSELLRAQAVAHPARDRALILSSRAADELETEVGRDGSAAEMYGMLHLTSAMNASALSREDESRDHEREAAEIARLVGSGSNFGNQNFGETNVGFWSVHLAVERGEGGRVAELARNINPSRISSFNRRAAFFTDIGRGLGSERGREEQAVVALRQAEELAPQRVRANPFVRDIVGEMLHRQGSAASDDLRGLAYRCGAASSP